MVESKTELPRNVQWELARIRRYPAVVSESVEYSVVEDNVARIGFQFRTDPLLDAEPAAPITDLEPVFLLYWSPSLVGRRAPGVLMLLLSRDTHQLVQMGGTDLSAQA